MRGTLQSGEARVEDVILPGPTVTLSGRVEAQTRCKCVWAQKVNAVEEPRFSVGAELQPNGRFTVDGLIKGRWRISVCGLEAITELPLTAELVIR